MNYRDGIDFIIVSYCKQDFVRLCVSSINKYIGDIEHTINVVVNYLDKDKEINFFQLASIDTPLKMVMELNRLKKEFN